MYNIYAIVILILVDIPRFSVNSLHQNQIAAALQKKNICVCVCVCVCACVRASVRACVRACVCVISYTALGCCTSTSPHVMLILLRVNTN